MRFTKRLVPVRYRLERIQFKRAAQYIRARHYTKGSHNGAFPCYGLFEGRSLVGVLMFATSCSENVRASVFGPDHKDTVTELHRLHLRDSVPKNGESWMIAKCLKMLKEDRPQTNGVIAYSDPTSSHVGTIYQATNAYYTGMTSPRRFYEDQSGRLRHPRQNGKNISVAEAKKKGWKSVRRQGKYRYVFIIGSRLNRKYWRALLTLPVITDYPRLQAQFRFFVNYCSFCVQNVLGFAYKMHTSKEDNNANIPSHAVRCTTRG